MKGKISILGSTGSIGTQTVGVAQRLNIPVAAIAAGRNVSLLEEQSRLLKPEYAALYDEAAASDLRVRLADTPVRVGSGAQGIVEAACIGGVRTVVTALSGSAGLMPTLAAIRSGRRIALANKETLVMAGDYVMSQAREHSAQIIPVDSEHSAVFQCLEGRDGAQLKKILLTASGGPFRGWTREQTASVTAEMAVAHPNWSMGAKISVDSATMMNKGLELIEAMHLFNIKSDKIKVLIHPESIVHSMVELTDGAVIAQLGVPEMTLPIQYAVTYPDRVETGLEGLDLARLSGLSFFEPDMEKTPCLALAVKAAQLGGTAPAVLNAANEAAVGLFLRRKIGFNDIYECVAAAMDSIYMVNEAALSNVLEADAAAREFVKEGYSKCISS